MASNGESHTTTDHDKIREWVEARGGVPSSATGATDDDAGLLRIDFRDDSGSLEGIDWDSFFKTFDENGLAFVYQERTSDGSQSRFNKFVRRDN